jgi:hypothetical protein
MDRPENETQSAENSQQSEPPVDSGIGNQPPNTPHDTNVNGNQDDAPRKESKKFRDLDIDRKIELFLTGAILFSAVCQIVVSLINNSGTSKQVDKIIATAGGIEEAANQIKQAGWVFSGAAMGINNAGWNAVGRLQEQADQVKRSANAANSSAATAKEAFHISERAFIYFANPSIEYPTKLMSIQVINGGHMAAHPVIVTSHEATFNLSTPAEKPEFRDAIEKSWQNSTFPSINQSSPLGLAIPVPSLDQSKVDQGLQIIVIAGFATYSDGFEKDLGEKQFFCIQTIFHLLAKKSLLTPCDSAYYLPKMEAVDGYPKNEAPH